jgi:hypothetical protein
MMYGIGIGLFALAIVAVMFQRYKIALATAVLGLMVLVASVS